MVDMGSTGAWPRPLGAMGAALLLFGLCGVSAGVSLTLVARVVALIWGSAGG